MKYETLNFAAIGIFALIAGVLLLIADRRWHAVPRMELDPWQRSLLTTAANATAFACLLPLFVIMSWAWLIHFQSNDPQARAEVLTKGFLRYLPIPIVAVCAFLAKLLIWRWGYFIFLFGPSMFGMLTLAYSGYLFAKDS